MILESGHSPATARADLFGIIRLPVADRCRRGLAAGGLVGVQMDNAHVCEPVEGELDRECREQEAEHLFRD